MAHHLSEKGNPDPQPEGKTNIYSLYNYSLFRCKALLGHGLLRKLPFMCHVLTFGAKVRLLCVWLRTNRGSFDGVLKLFVRKLVTSPVLASIFYNLT